MPLKDGMVQVAASIPEALSQRLAAECRAGGVSVSAYIRALLEGATWELDRAQMRLTDGAVTEAELDELVEADPRPASMGILEAARVYDEARRAGRHIPLKGGDVE